MAYEIRYDFYYSKKQEQDLIKYQEKKVPYVESFFKGRLYTEMIDTGRTPMSKYDDMVKLGTGINEDITFNRQTAKPILSADNWISVDNFLPNETKWYKVRMESGKIKKSFFISPIRGEGSWNRIGKRDVVTHWTK